MFYVFILVHLSVFEFASNGLKLVRSSLKKGAGVPENCVLACVCKVELKGITLSRLCYHSSESTRGNNTTLCLAYHICYICYIYIYKYINICIMYVYYVCNSDSIYVVSLWDNTKHNAIYGNIGMYLVCLMSRCLFMAVKRQMDVKLSTAHYYSVMSHTTSNTRFHFRNSEFTFIHIVFLQCIIFSVN